MSDKYDSSAETQKHIDTVASIMRSVADELVERARLHDKSKLCEPEKSMYDEFTPLLRSMTYGSDEYKACLKDMGEALDHHYSVNRHHPEHFDMLQCPVCHNIYNEKDVAIDARLVEDIRLCPECCKHGTIMECVLVPVSGVYGMNVIDLVEMLCDWKAASMRHADGDVMKSIEINRKRFKMSDQIVSIFKNTIDWMKQETA